MEHLFPSVVQVTQLSLEPTPGGRMKMTRVPVKGLGKMRCRLDLQFLRPGRDTPPAAVAGAIPDREGIMFCKYSPLLKAGMQVTTIPDRRGLEVVQGVFEIREIPDVALDFSTAHHIEVKVIESVQKNIDFPDLPNSIPPLPQDDSDAVAYPYDED